MSSIRRNTAVGAGCAVLALIVATATWAGSAPQQTAEPPVVEEKPQNDSDFVFFGPELEAFWQDDVTIERFRDMERDMERALAQAGQIRVSPGGAWRVRSSASAVSRVLAHAEDIGLTEDQEEDQIRELQRGVRREQIRRDADLEIAEMDLEEMMDNNGANLDVIEQKMREVANLGVDARMAGMRLERDVMALLTPEQRDDLEELMPERVIYESILRQRRR